MGLKSAKRDVYAYASFFSKHGFHPYICIDDPKDLQWVVERLKHEGIESYSVVDGFASIAHHLHDIAQATHPCDVIMTVSAHGFGGTQTNFFMHHGVRIDGAILRQLYKPFEATNNCIHRVVTFIDTCHSGNMTNFQHAVPVTEAVSDIKGSIVAIAGCTPTQSLMEDISDQYGYGGGLTAAILDGLKDIKGDAFDLNVLAEYVYGRVLKLGAHVSVSQVQS